MDPPDGGDGYGGGDCYGGGVKGCVGAGGGGDGIDCCGSSNPVGAAAALAKVWEATPAQSYHHINLLGCVDLDDDVWEIRFHFAGLDNLERKIGRSDITYMNLLAMIESVGYGIIDKMYYVKEEGRGVSGMGIIDGMSKVTEMVQLNEHKQCISITVINAKSQLGANINRPAAEVQVPIAETGDHVVYSVDNDGVFFNSQESEENSDYLYMCTQQSNNNNVDKQKCIIVVEDEVPVNENMAHAECFGISSDEEMAEEVEDDSEEGEEDSEAEFEDGDEGEDNEAKNQRLSGLKRKKVESMGHYEGDSDVEDLFPVVETDSDECIPISSLKKLPVKKGPTSRSHCSSAIQCKPDYVPSSDENFEAADSEEDEVPIVLPNGRKL